MLPVAQHIFLFAENENIRVIFSLEDPSSIEYPFIAPSLLRHHLQMDISETQFHLH